MKQPVWAKFPSRWIQRLELEASDPSDPDSYHHPMRDLMWDKHHATAIAAIVVLFALAIRLNQLGKDLDPRNGDVRPTVVGLTYEELRKMTGFAKVTIAGALNLLQGLEAIRVVKGHSSRYELIGLENNKGGWRKLPQEKLLNGDGSLLFKQEKRNKVTLNALKIYLLMVHLRNDALNTTALSYTAITRWTGVRREEIPVALGMLGNMDLVRRSFERDFRHSREGGDDQSHRYVVQGLSYRIPDAQDDAQRDPIRKSQRGAPA
ncbi:MAG: hypothetical protein JSS56_15695 [Proteobacteria bacterium]|nr:hypothetical protein [Pseudomonadota bacterium]